MLLFVAILGIILVLTQKLWMPRILVAYVLWETKDNSLALDSIPVAREISLATTTHITQMKYADLSFSLPFSVIKDTRLGSSSLAVRIDEDSTVVFLGRGNRYWQSWVTDARLIEMYDNKLLTNFDVYKAIMDTRYTDISVFYNTKDALGESMLLLQKSVIVPPHETTITSFENTHGIRGFEFTQSASSSIVTIFTPQDLQFEVLFRGLTRGEIDHILESITEN